LQIGTRLFVATLFFQLVVVSNETSVIADLQPAAGCVKQRGVCPTRIALRDLFEGSCCGIESPRQIVRLRR
jgi:hypothetical protein